MAAQVQTRSATRAAQSSYDAKSRAYYMHMEAMKDPENMHHAWKIQTTQSNKTYYVIAETKADCCASQTKELQKLLRHSSCGFNCRLCSELAHTGALLWGYDGPLMFQGDSWGLELVQSCRKIAERIALTGQSKLGHTVRLRLLTIGTLHHDQQVSGVGPDGEQYQHFTPQSEEGQYHTSLTEEEQLKDRALQTLTQRVNHFINKLLELGKIDDLRERARKIRSALGKTRDGVKKYGHAIEWLERILLLVHAHRLSDWSAANMVDRIPIIAEALLSGHTGLGDDGKSVVCFPLQEANNAMWNWLVKCGSDAEMLGLINATLSPKNYQQRAPEKAPTVANIKRTQEVFGNISLRVAGLYELARDRPNDVFLPPTGRSRVMDGTPSQASAAFDKLLQEASRTTTVKKQTLPTWKKDPTTIRSVQELAEYISTLPSGHRVEICTHTTTYDMDEAALITEISDVDNSYFKLKGEDDRRAYGWSFLGHGSAHGRNRRGWRTTACNGGWKNLRGIMFLRTNDSALFVTDDAEALWRGHGRSQQTFLGTWTMSSMGQRSHGESFVRLIKHMKTESTRDVADVPLIANGLCRDSSDGRLNQLSLRNSLEWRTVDASGNKSRVYKAKYFYTPEPEKVVTPIAPPAKLESTGASIVDELRSLANMRDSGILTHVQFEAAKERLLCK